MAEGPFKNIEMEAKVVIEEDRSWTDAETKRLLFLMRSTKHTVQVRAVEEIKPILRGEGFPDRSVLGLQRRLRVLAKKGEQIPLVNVVVEKAILVAPKSVDQLEPKSIEPGGTVKRRGIISSVAYLLFLVCVAAALWQTIEVSLALYGHLGLEYVYIPALLAVIFLGWSLIFGLAIHYVERLKYHKALDEFRRYAINLGG